MSLRKHLLNRWLKFSEKPLLARATPEELRADFERKARLLFRSPRGTRMSWRNLGHEGRELPALEIAAPAQGPLILYFHGGAYVFGSPRTHAAMLARLSRLSDLPALLPQYRLAPEHPFPAAVEDALLAYRAVLDHPGGVVLGGDSAGGGLALALLAEITRQGLPQPRGTFAFSPLTDLEFTSGTLRSNATAEAILPAARAPELAAEYLAGADAADPRASPVNGDFSGAGPVWLTAGDTEILLDDTRRMAARLQQQGVDVTCEIARDLPHVWPIFQGILPEATETLRALAQWIRSLPPPSGDS